MCGIAGFTKSDKALAQQILSSIAHRGPDGSGIWANEFLTLAQIRLSILDLTDAGFQPMFYDAQFGACSEKFNPKYLQNAQVSIVFNGEIYNFQEIREELRKKGYQFTTNCDTEVLLAAYLEYGENCVSKLNGMWAFCIYDLREQKLFLSRDRLGEKPLYYTLQDGIFAFGSEMKTILPFVKHKKINENSLQNYFFLGFTPSETSILEGISKLAPACNLVFSLKNQEIKIKKYWNISFETKKIDFEQACQKIRELFDDAVRLRMIADVPVGAFLSGGVDSSAIVAYMRKYVKELKTFSVGFDYKDFNESEWALQVAKKFETDHTQILFTAQDVKNLIDELPYFYDEPFGDSSMIPTYLVSKVARKQVTVCLSGTGGDEFFGGYTRYKEFTILEKLLSLPSFLKTILSKTYSFFNQDKASKLELLLKSSGKPELYLRLFTHLFRGKNEPHFDFEKISPLEKYLKESDSLTSLLNFDQHLYLPEDLLIKEDRATMANSLEGRIPFLDYKLVEFANSLPSEWKLKNGEGKYILKKALEPILPKEILYRKKQGFGVPLNHYFRKELKKYAEEIIFDPKTTNFYDHQILQNLWQKHQNGSSDYSHLFWNLMMFSKWNNRWFN